MPAAITPQSPTITPQSHLLWARLPMTPPGAKIGRGCDNGRWQLQRWCAQQCEVRGDGRACTERWSLVVVVGGVGRRMRWP
eukprot:gene9899-biopygen18249